MSQQPQSAPRSARLGPLLLVVALIVGTRVFGISALMPVLSPYAAALTTSALLAGLAFGGYGLTMAVMQTPLGALSDRIGRRRVILAGVLVAVAGNLIAYWAPDIRWLIVGRFIEGLGAVSSVALAALSDHVPDERRTVALAVAGISAGLAFLIGVAVGPALADVIGVRAIFVLSAGLGVAVFLAAWMWLPPDGTPEPTARGDDGRVVMWSHPGLLSVAWAGAVMNVTLTATMFALPLLLVGAADDPDGPLTGAAYRNLLLVTVLIGGILSIGAARTADRRGAVVPVMWTSALLIGGGAAALLALDALPMLYIAAVLYFAGHGAQSAALPSRIGALIGRAHRGTAMGAYTSSTFLGSFLGGLLGAAWWDQPERLAVALAALGLVTALLLAASARARPGRT